MLTSVFRPESRTVISDTTLQNLVTENTFEESTTTEGSVTEGSTAMVEEVTQEQTEISVRISVENLDENLDKERIQDSNGDVVEDLVEDQLRIQLRIQSRMLSRRYQRYTSGQQCFIQIESVQPRLIDEGYPSEYENGSFWIGPMMIYFALQKQKKLIICIAQSFSLDSLVIDRKRFRAFKMYKK
ncbi:unnamed protein product [Mucor hiemalis]